MEKQSKFLSRLSSVNKLFIKNENKIFL